MRTYAQLTTSFVVFCNRVGVDESISFWGGSEVIGPGGEAVFSAPLFDEGLFFADIDLADVRRERISLPLLRDERPELVAREWRRLIAERSGLAHDATAEPGARDGFDVAVDVVVEPPSARESSWTRRRRGRKPRPSGDGHHGDVRPARTSSPSTRTSRAGSSPTSSAASCARRASSGRCSGCRAGSTPRWWPTSSPRRSVPSGCCAS